jgi:hypothetical protein
MAGYEHERVSAPGADRSGCEGIAVVVVQQDGVCVRSGLAGPYPAGVDLDHAAQTIFADLVTALAIKQRMARVWWRNMDGPCMGQET